VVAVASYLNYRYLRLPSAIGLMVIGLALSFVLVGLHAAGLGLGGRAEASSRSPSRCSLGC
jgi:CPA1 family monovalent cation:H+ antiporter